MGTQAALETITRVSSYEADKEAAREIQYSPVPSGSLISAGVEVAYRFSPFAEVGWDFTDFFLFAQWSRRPLPRRYRGKRTRSRHVCRSRDGNSLRHQQN